MYAVDAGVSEGLVAEGDGDGWGHDAGVSAEHVSAVAAEAVSVGHVALSAEGVQRSADAA
jgi:hypothetical protein